MRLRQIALVARELDPVVEDLCAVLGLEVCFRDPGVAEFGLHNALMPIGTCFLEVVSPMRPDTTAGRLLGKRGGDGGYMVIAQTDDLPRDRRRLAALGVRIVWQIELPDAQTIHLHPRDIGAAILSLDQMPEPESWRWGGPSWRSHMKTDVTKALVGAELQSPQPGALAARWGQVFGREPTPGRGRSPCARARSGRSALRAPARSPWRGRLGHRCARRRSGRSGGARAPARRADRRGSRRALRHAHPPALLTRSSTRRGRPAAGRASRSKTGTGLPAPRASVRARCRR